MSYTAIVRIRRGGEVIHQEIETFERRQMAIAWIKKRETELAVPGAIEALKAPDPTLSAAIEKYVTESRRAIGKTKTQVLTRIQREAPIAAMRCSAIGSKELIEFLGWLKATPQTAGNYFAHLAAVFKVARPAWGYPLNWQAAEDARMVATKMGLIGRSAQRTRRPTLPELDRVMEHFSHRTGRANSIPMLTLIPFAIFSTRRLEEITRLRWADLNEQHSEIIVRDMKHPGEKAGNDVRVTLTPEALRIIQVQPREGERIFPCSAESASAAFTRAIQLLGIEDLHFHDLRHEGISRLFEMGWTIPQVATVSGHRSWVSLIDAAI
ncbi:MAG: tyrosine-type recombinase/integrase [Candidatus Protistobacter heckmanni]|nr:tyrosine-type recombinase/integrase [Candidatus Protistobacter heckmanni]